MSSRIPTPKDVMPRLRPPADQLLLARMEQMDGGLYRLALDNYTLEQANLGFNPDDFPVSGGVRGGAARQILRAALLGQPEEYPPRDVDVMQAGWMTVSREARWQLDDFARQLAPNDYKNGYGVDGVCDPEKYMKEQDFTMNQLLACKEENGQWSLYTTERAVCDTANNTIRPTLYEFDRDEDYRLSVKLALKAVRLLSELQVDGAENASIRGINLKEADNLHHDAADDYFMQILQLDKALETGYNVAEQYLRNLRRYKLYPDCTASGSPGRVYESLQQEVDFCMSEGAKEALLRGQVEEPRPAPLTCKIGEVATIRIK